MNLNRLFSMMEKVGSLSFENESERNGFFKIAQDVMTQTMPPMGQDPSSMGQPQGQPQGQPGMPDPSMGQGQQGPAPAQAPVPAEMPGDVPSPSVEETIIGETIKNSDIESLVRIINILTSLKSKYDSMKKQQMDLIKQQMAGTQPGA
jgi:hypothetical protein